ncbi:MAG: serine/threonine protein kinase [Planctomycetes bacterium]|nr:serine/threonine protein kinase [Planctomycetota bacterium]MCB9871768.1 serine/threonine protein kinase [Planctomycetota bacterium]
MSTPELDTGSDERNPVEVIAAEFVARMRRGEQPTVEDYVARFPAQAADIRELLPTVVAMEQLKSKKEESDHGRFLRGLESLSLLGDYRILGEIGRGGMGIVYEAEQESLGRRVAVKVLPRQSMLDERRLMRFHREAQTAARLHHTNIVPIFGVGEQDGYHYYVMQRIRGLGLDQVLRTLRGERIRSVPGSDSTELDAMAVAAAQRLRGEAARNTGPSTGSSGTHADLRPEPSAAYWRSIARIGVQIADALAYAHSQGTLHRDIKPSNLLLDAQGVVWVTDFGLAKAIEDSNLTNSGDVVGTLQYMAPEQLGGVFDARSDIYGLGLTLYELLTLQPAFGGSNRSGLLQKVSQGQAPRPSKLRAELPADFETIVLTAMDRDPRHRYQTAALLRDDLQRFLEDRPILARRSSRVQLAWRWCRRNRALASAVAVAMLSVLIALVVGWRAYFVATAQNLETQEAKALAERRMKLLLSTLEGLSERLVGESMFQAVIHNATDGSRGADTEDPLDTGTSNPEQSISIPTVSAKDARLLQEILSMWDRFAAEDAGTPTRVDGAWAHYKAGNIQFRLGEYRAAQKSYVKAILRFQAAGETTDPVTVARIRNQLGQVYAKRGMLDAARESHHMVVDALESDGKSTRDDVAGMLELARAHDFLGSWGAETPDEPRRGHRGRRGRPDRGFRRPPPGEPLAELRESLSAPVRLRHHERAQELLDELVARDRDDPGLRLALARSCRDFAGFLFSSPTYRRRAAPRAGELADRARSLLDALCREFPDEPQYRYELAETLAVGPPQPTELEAASVILRELCTAHPTVPAYKSSLARVLQRLARERFVAFRFSQGEAESREAIALLRRLCKLQPEAVGNLLALARVRWPYAEALLRLGDVPTAQEQLEASIRELEEYAARMRTGEERGLLVRYELLLGVLEWSGQQEEAAAARKRLVELREALRR